MARQRKCCRCPRPSEVDSDSRGENLLLLLRGRLGGVVRIIDCVEKNLQTSYCAPPLYFSPPSVESQLARKTDTVRPSTIITRSPPPRKTHDRAWLPCIEHSTPGNRRKDRQVVRDSERTHKHNQRETTYVTMTGERIRKHTQTETRRRTWT